MNREQKQEQEQKRWFSFSLLPAFNPLHNKDLWRLIVSTSIFYLKSGVKPQTLAWLINCIVLFCFFAVV